VFFGNEAIPVGEQLCPSLAGLLDSLLPDNFAAGAAAVPDPAAGGAEPPNPDQAANELGNLLGVNP
jgi:hypothetical protein